jgi:hypothetical protein
MALTDLRRGAVALLATLVLLGTPGCASDEEIARDRLARLGYTDIALTLGSEGEYAFTATDDTGNKACHGTIRVRRSRVTRPRVASIGIAGGCHVPTGK